ncbi:MAG: hypothetical protein ACI4JB_03570 [Porcipelethomonas sp.]
MFKALLKKQLLEMTSFIYQNRKNGGKRSKAALIGYAILLIYAFGVIGVMFFMMCNSICDQYFDAGFGWLYFALIGIMATGMGVLGSVFMIYSTIYQPKDNEFILSMPVPPLKVLISRLSGSYIMTFVFEAITLIPCYIVFFINRTFSPLDIIVGIVGMFLLPLLALSLACILGWLIAVVAAKLPKSIKTIVTLIVALAFFGGYMYIASGATDFFQKLIADPENIAGAAQYVFYPIYAFGRGAAGEPVYFLFFAVIVLAVFALICLVLDKTFLSLSTVKKGSSAKKFSKKELNNSSADSALLRREFIHLKSSSMYMLNCCMGTVFTIIAVVMIFVKRDFLSIIPSEFTGLAVCAGVALISSMNDLTAASVSLEGKSIWIVQSLPVSPWKVLRSKITLHMILTAVPALILAAAAEYIFDLSLTVRIILPLLAIIFPFFEAVFGLMLNLKMPNLNWTNETVAVKQGGNIMLALFGSWGILVAMGLLYIPLSMLSADIYLIICTAIMFVLSAVLLTWIKKRGTEIFSNL